MPGLPNQNWIVDPKGRRAPPILGTQVMPQGGGGLPQGISGGDQGYTRQVQANELMSTHAQELARGDNRLITDARARGVRAGASRGGINSNLAAAGGEESALNQVAQMAAQQAGAFGNAATQNLDSLGRQRIASEGNASSETVAGIGAGASMYNSDNDLLSQREGRAQDRDLTLSGRDWQSGESNLDRTFRGTEAQRDRDFTTGRDATQHGYQREIDRDRYGYEQRSADEAATRDADQYMFRNLIDNPEEFDPEVLQGLQAFWATFRRSSVPNLAKPAVVPGGP